MLLHWGVEQLPETAVIAELLLKRPEGADVEMPHLHIQNIRPLMSMQTVMMTMIHLCLMIDETIAEPVNQNYTACETSSSFSTSVDSLDAICTPDDPGFGGGSSFNANLDLFRIRAPNFCNTTSMSLSKNRDRTLGYSRRKVQVSGSIAVRRRRTRSSPIGHPSSQT